MGEIKSALEIALEKTESVKGDKESLERAKYIENGKRLASKLFSEPDYNLEKDLKIYKGKERDWVRKGFFETALANIALPSSESDISRLEQAMKGISLVINDRKNIEYLKKQLVDFYKRFLEDRTQLIEALRNQFSGRIRQKEQELSEKMGTEVQLDPASDPEFNQYLNENLNRMKEQYGQALDEAKEELRRLFEKSK